MEGQVVKWQPALCFIAMLFCLSSCSSEIRVDPFHLARATRSRDTAEKQAEAAERSVIELRKRNRELEQSVSSLRVAQGVSTSEFEQCQEKVRPYGVRAED